MGSAEQGQQLEKTDCYLRSYSTTCAAEFCTKHPKQVRSLPYTPGDELAHGRAAMRQGFYCGTPAEADTCHDLFTAALASPATEGTARV